MSTILGSKLAGAAPQAAPASSVSRPLTRTLASGRRGELVPLPFLGPAWIELPGAVAWEGIQIAARRELAEAGLEVEIGTADILELKLARHVLACAVRDPNDRTAPFGTLDEWGQLDADIINAAWQAFGDVRERLDPIAVGLTDDERTTIELGLKKKDGALLRSFGVAKLSSYLLSTAAPQSTSSTPSSPSTES
jgi:hypothetical protein